MLGYFLGKRFAHQIEEYLVYIIIGFIFITTIPLIVTFVKKKVNRDGDEDETEIEEEKNE